MFIEVFLFVGQSKNEMFSRTRMSASARSLCKIKMTLNYVYSLIDSLISSTLTLALLPPSEPTRLAAGSHTIVMIAVVQLDLKALNE